MRRQEVVPEPLSLEIAEADEIVPCGVVSHIVGDKCIIAAPLAAPPLDLDSVLCFEDRTPLGKVCAAVACRWTNEWMVMSYHRLLP